MNIVKHSSQKQTLTKKKMMKKNINLLLYYINDAYLYFIHLTVTDIYFS